MRHLLLIIFFISSCSNTLTKQKSGNYTEIYRSNANIENCTELLSNFLNNPNTKISKNQLILVQDLLNDLSVPKKEIKRVKTYNLAIEMAFEKITDDGKRSVEHGEKMAQFGKKLREIYASASLPAETLKDLDFYLGRNVLRAEEFTADEFKIVKDEDFSLGKNTDLFHIGYKDYKAYVLGIEENKPPFTGLNLTGRIISRSDIREMEALNHFPVYIKHDMAHIRYGFYHERYMPMLFGAARSKNHLRYVMLSALAEGADQFQFQEERAISKYFGLKNLSLEEAILLIARSTEEELNQISHDALTEYGYNIPLDSFTKLVNEYYTSWKPQASATWPVKGKTGSGLDQEIKDMVELFKRQHSDPDVIEHYNQRKSNILY